MNNEKFVVFDIETTGLNPWYGNRVTCICAKDSDGKCFESYVPEQQHQDLAEKEVIEGFCRWLYKRCDWILISKNGKMFDVPFLCSRANILDANDWGVLLDMEHIDLQEATERRVSLKDMATLLGCENKSGSGKEAIKLWNDGEYMKLKDYCMQDVEVTQQIFLKLKELSPKLIQALLSG